MSTKPVRVPEEPYNHLRELAAKLNVPLSEAAELAIETGLENLDLRDEVNLDPDLEQEFTPVAVQGTSQEAQEKLDELYRRQIDRNWERSELVEEPQ